MVKLRVSWVRRWRSRLRYWWRVWRGQRVWLWWSEEGWLVL